MVGGVLDGVHGLRTREPDEVAGADRSHVGRRACADPDYRMSEQALVDQDAVDAGKREWSDRSRCEACRLLDLGGAGDARLGRTGGQRDLPEVGAPISRHERHHGPAVAEDHDRLDDLLEGATGGASGLLGSRGALLELLEASIGACLPEMGGNPFHGLGPGRTHEPSVPIAPHPNRPQERCTP